MTEAIAYAEAWYATTGQEMSDADAEYHVALEEEQRVAALKYPQLTAAQFRLLMMAVMDYQTGLLDNGRQRDHDTLGRALAKVQKAMYRKAGGAT